MHHAFLVQFIGTTVLALLTSHRAECAPRWQDTRPVAHYARAEWADPHSAARVKAVGNLAGAAGSCCVVGWVEYDFDVPTSGWYELSVAGSGAQVEYFVNLKRSGSSGYAFDSGGNVVDGFDKVGNFWLTAGRNSVRLQRYYWTGFPRITSVLLRASSSNLAGSMRATIDSGASVFRAGQCAPLVIHYGALASSTTLTVRIQDSTGQQIATHDLTLAAATALRRELLPLPCDREGDYLVDFRDKSAGWLAWRDVRGISYQVIARKETSSVSSARELLRDIDLSTRQPDYEGGDSTRVMSTDAGSYRESGSAGFTQYQRTAEVARRTMPEPSWFAYALDGLSPQVLHEVEVDYPDDAERSVVLALRDEAPLSYPVSSGFDTGGEFTLTHRMQRHSILFWPRGTKTRIVIMNVHDGRRAAAARVRVYRRGEPPLPSIASGGRQVLQWYEEGNNFHSVVGTPDPHRYEWRALPRRIGIERWIRLSRYGGANVLAPTVGVYSFGLYPSSFNRSFSTPDADELRLMLLLAEKHGMHVIPELHPRADELDWPFANAGHPRPNLLWSREGKTSFFQHDGKTRNVPPHYNPIHPSNQEWYVGHIAELANRYKDSPALQGISVRLMPWANASLNNFASLDWGYDDFSVSQFVHDTSIALPRSLLAASKNADDAAKQAITRHQWIMRHARAAWIAWRCTKITALFARIRDVVRAARPDLKLYTTVFAWDEAAQDSVSLREAAIDVNSISALEGVEVVEARGTYGRREPDAASNQRRRQRLLAPEALTASPARALLSTASYVEATEAIIPPQRIGLPAQTKQTWLSAAMVPAGAHILERYATQLARNDAYLLGDGGNGYAIGQPVLHAWLREFTALPARAFTDFPGAPAPLKVRWLEYDGKLLVYALNTEARALVVSLSLEGARETRRLGTGDVLRTEKGLVRLELGPFDLVALEAPEGARLREISVTRPD